MNRQNKNLKGWTNRTGSDKNGQIEQRWTQIDKQMSINKQNRELDGWIDGTETDMLVGVLNKSRDLEIFFQNLSGVNGQNQLRNLFE